MTAFTSLALAPKRSLAFLIREYLEPLSNGERLLVGATFLASFVSANGVQARLHAAYGNAIGWVGAIAIEAVYLGAALAGTSARHRSRWQFIGIWAVLLIAGALAVVFNLAHEEEARGVLTAYTVIEAVGFPVLSILCAVLSHGLAGERLAVVERRQEAERQRTAAAQDAQRALEQQYKTQRMQLELHALEQEQATRLAMQQAEQEERLKALRRELRSVRGTVNTGVTDIAAPERQAASGRRATPDREQLKATLVDTVRLHGEAFNKQAFAKEHGISRPYVYTLLEELRTEERLP